MVLEEKSQTRKTRGLYTPAEIESVPLRPDASTRLALRRVQPLRAHAVHRGPLLHSPLNLHHGAHVRKGEGCRIRDWYVSAALEHICSARTKRIYRQLLAPWLLLLLYKTPSQKPRLWDRPSILQERVLLSTRPRRTLRSHPCLPHQLSHQVPRRSCRPA